MRCALKVTTGGPGFSTTCGLDCDCLLKERPECTECAVEDDRLLVTCTP